MKCKRVRELLPLYADGDLEGRAQEAVARHLESCPECRRRLALDRELATKLSALPAPAGAAEMAANVRAAVMTDVARKRRWQPFWRVAERIGNATVWTAVSAVTVLLLVALTVTWRSLNQRPGEGVPYGPPATGMAPPVTATGATERVNILLLGIDRRDDDAGPWRTDTLIVFSIDPAGKSASMLSIPRDLWVTLPGCDAEERISAAYAYGDQVQYPGGGAELAKKTVEYNLGIPIQYYVRLDFNGFARIIDSLGGIEVDVPRDIVDNAYPTADYGTMQVRIPAGRQVMNGDLALKYARIRHDSSDFYRMARQQQVIMAVRDKVLSLDYPVTRIPDLLSLLGDSLQTDIGLEGLYAVAQAARQVPAESIQSAVIDESMVTDWRTPQGWSVLVAQPEKVRELVARLFPMAGSPPVAAPQFGQPQDLFTPPSSAGWYRISPDGEWVLWPVPEGRSAMGTIPSHLEADSTGPGGPAQVALFAPEVPGGVGDGQAVWFPDGRRVLVTTSRGPAQVLVLALDQSAARTLARAPEGSAGFGEAAISPDGEQIAVAVLYADGSAPVPRIGIEAMNADGSGRREVVAPDYFIGHLAWTPDGTQVVYFKGKGGTPPEDGDAYVVDAAGGTEPQLLFPRLRLAAWSPSGTQALWLSEPADDQGRADLALTSWPPAGEPRPLARAVAASSVAWAGSDGWLVFSQDGALYLGSSGGTGILQRLAPEGEIPDAPVWLPGRGLAYRVDRDGRAALRLLPLASTGSPTATPPATPTPQSPPGSSLAIQASWSESGSGALEGDIVITNQGQAAYSLQGVPLVEILAADGQVVPTVNGEWDNVTPDWPVDLVVLQPGQQASAHLVWANYCGPEPSLPLQLRVTLPGPAYVQLTVADLKPVLPRCNVEGPASALTVWPFVAGSGPAEETGAGLVVEEHAVTTADIMPSRAP